MRGSVFENRGLDERNTGKEIEISCLKNNDSFIFKKQSIVFCTKVLF